jgi:gliding motility-associated protein GldM
MGAKNCPETPRQKLIAMMYLVLTALLALNVSVDILNAFIVVNESIEKSNEIFSEKVEANYSAFERALAENETKVRPDYDKAKQVKAWADEMVAYIQSIKWEVIAKTEGISLENAKTVSIKDVKRKDNYDTPTNYFIGDSPDGSKGKARELKDKIIEFKQNILSVLPEEKHESVQIGLHVEESLRDPNGKVKNWEMFYFYRTILAADIVILNKLITDIRNAESGIVTELLTSIGETDFKFNKIAAKVVPRSKFIISGEEYEADIFVAAYDTIDAPEVIIGTAYDSISGTVQGTTKVLEGERGLVKYRVPSGGPGVQTFGGIIRLRQPGGGIVEYGFNEEYVVGAPTATVSADKMNVFYIGVDNPVTISVPGIPNEKVRPSMTNGRLTPQGGGKYIVRVEGGNEAVVSVAAELGGQTRSMGQVKFRVRRVPDPVPFIAGVREGNIEKARLVASPVIIPVLENFEFDLSFTIVSYTFEIQMPGGDIIEKQGSGNRLTQEMIGYVQNARRGQKCYITNIRASGPSGTRSIGAITIRIV